MVKDITSIITTLGFPIALCLMLLWYIKDLTEKHKSETDSFVEALNANTIAIQKLADNLEKKEWKKNGQEKVWYYYSCRA